MKRMILGIITGTLFLSFTACENGNKTESASPISDTSLTSIESANVSTNSTEGTSTLISDPNSDEVMGLYDLVRGATVNGNKEFISESMLLSIIDLNIYTSATVALDFSDNIAYIKDVTGNNNLKPGLNMATITIANQKAEAKIAWLIYCQKYDSNYSYATNAYISTRKFYWGDGLSHDYDTMYTQPGSYELPLCANLADVSSKLLSSDGFKQFISYYEDLHLIVCKDDKYYFDYPPRGSDMSYTGTVLIPKSLSADKLVYTAQSYYNGQSDYTTESADFVLVNQNGQWLVDNFELPN